MKVSTKSALFSAVIFPGAGYFTLGLKYRGCIYILISIIFILLLANDAHYKAEIMVNSIIQNNNFNIELEELLRQIRQIPSLYSANQYLAIYSGLGMTWLISIMDCYRLGKKKERTR